MIEAISSSPTSRPSELFEEQSLEIKHPLQNGKQPSSPEGQAMSSESNYLQQPTSSLQVMLKQETKSYRAQCLQGFDLDDQSPVLDWFRTMANWCYVVADGCKLSNDVVDVAFNFLDRFLICNCGSLSNKWEVLKDTSRFQKVTMTCLYIAAKTSSARCLTPALLQQISRQEILAEDIEAMELVILFDLGFHITPPTILSLAKAYAQEQLQLWNFDAVGGKEEKEEQQSTRFLQLVEQQARQAICKLYTLYFPISVISLACVRNALEIMQDHDALPTFDFLLKGLVFDIASLSLNAKVRKASGQTKREFVSQQCQLQTSLLGVALQTSSKWTRVDPATMTDRMNDNTIIPLEHRGQRVRLS